MACQKLEHLLLPEHRLASDGQGSDEQLSTVLMHASKAARIL